MCHDRLAEGEAPACVQSCPNGAISIELIDTEEIRKKAEREESIIPGAFRSDYTFPSTVYTSKRELSSTMTPADEHSIQASHKHTPLSWMLSLTQLSVGISTADLLARIFAPEWSLPLQMPLTIIAILLGLVGLGSSMLHLGSPMGCWRVFLGLKTSWLSREIVLFGMWMPALLLYALLTYLPVPNSLVIAAGFATVLLGLLSVYCSIMVYVDTKREFWSLGKTTSKFMGTVFIGGATTLLITSLSSDHNTPGVVTFFFILAILAKAAADTISLKAAQDSTWSMAKKSALIQLRTLRPTMLLRWGMMALCILAVLLTLASPIFSVVAIAAMLFGEFLQRQIFFQAVVTLKMPGNLER